VEAQKSTITTETGGYWFKTGRSLTFRNLRGGTEFNDNHRPRWLLV